MVFQTPDYHLDNPRYRCLGSLECGTTLDHFTPNMTSKYTYKTALEAGYNIHLVWAEEITEWANVLFWLFTFTALLLLLEWLKSLD